MYISPIIVGILGTLLFEMVIMVGIVVSAFFKEYSKNQNDDNDDK